MKEHYNITTGIRLWFFNIFFQTLYETLFKEIFTIVINLDRDIGAL